MPSGRPREVDNRPLIDSSAAERLVVALLLCVITCFFATLLFGYLAREEAIIIGEPDNVKAYSYAAVPQLEDARRPDERTAEPPPTPAPGRKVQVPGFRGGDEVRFG